MMTSSVLQHNQASYAVKVIVCRGVSFWPVNLLGFRGDLTAGSAACSEVDGAALALVLLPGGVSLQSAQSSRSHTVAHGRTR